MTFRHRGWYITMGLAKAGPCPICCAVVHKVHWREHQRRCEEIEDMLGQQREPEPDGYIIGDGPLPASVRGGIDEDEHQGQRR